MQYGDIAIEQLAETDWVLRGLEEDHHFDTLIAALEEFDEILSGGSLPKAQLVWSTERDAALELLAESGAETIGASVEGGLALVGDHWIPIEFHDFYGGDISKHLEVAAEFSWSTGAKTYYAYQDFYIVEVWHPEEGTELEIDYELPEDEDFDEIEDGFLEFARFIGLDTLDRAEWFDLPDDANKVCDFTSWWDYGGCTIAELSIFFIHSDESAKVLVYDVDRKKVIGVFPSVDEVFEGMTAEDGVKYNISTETRDEWWIDCEPPPKFGF